MAEEAEDRALRKTYRAVHRKLEALAERPLDELLGQCAEAQAPYPEPEQFADDPDLRRLLWRVGLVSRNCAAANLFETVHRIADASQERRELVRRVLGMYCAPAEGIPRVICADEPACEECPLRDACKFFRRTPSITELPEDQRPRERLLAEGEQALSDAELLAIILRSGTPDETAIGLAHRLLAKYGNFRTLATRTAGELSSLKGIGPAKTAQIKAAFEIARRHATQRAAEPGRHITDSGTVFEMCEPLLRDRKEETFLVLLLDTKNRVFRELTVSKGTLTSSLVHPREVFSEAIRESAKAIVCVHNHPSGDPTPSRQDTQITRRLHATSQLTGISLLDHVIIGDGRYYSFADEGQLPEERPHAR